MLAHSDDAMLEYYRYLNSGYRLPLVGGTDKMSSAVPVGLYRTYARLDEEFSYEAWCRAVRSGRTFAISERLSRVPANTYGTLRSGGPTSSRRTITARPTTSPGWSGRSPRPCARWKSAAAGDDQAPVDRAGADLMRHLATAAFLACGYLTGMRPGRGPRPANPEPGPGGTAGRHLTRGHGVTVGLQPGRGTARRRPRRRPAPASPGPGRRLPPRPALPWPFRSPRGHLWCRPL